MAVYGYEVDAAFSEVSGLLPPGSYNGFGCGGGCETDISWMTTLRGRIGVAQGKALIYATGGVAVAGLSAGIVNDSTRYTDSQTQVGWTAGVGAEFMVNDRTSIRGEILYTDLGELRYDDGSATPPFEVDVTMTQFVLGVNFRF